MPEMREGNSMTATLTADQANAIYDILVQHAGASERGRDDFVCVQVDVHVDEYRFQGALGMGGKFWNYRDRWYVTAYPELLKSRPELKDSIDAANAALIALKGTV
jgi:hypothetical protein